MEDRSRVLGEIAHDAIERLIRDVLARRPGGHLVEATLDRFLLRVPFVARGAGSGAPAFSERLVAAVERWVDDAIEHAAAFRPGHAFCYRCVAASCDHSAPPSHRHVFTGYAPTGAPRWEDFAQHCLDRRHPEVDRLFDDPPAFATFVAERAELEAGLLGAFREGARYALRGQVAAGFFPVRTVAGEGRGVVAVTFQVGASQGRDGRQRFGLNVLGTTPQGGPLDLLWERHEAIPWLATVRWAQSVLATIDARRREPAGLEGRIGGILNGIARRLRHERRARGRKTLHADARHREGGRPTGTAHHDAGQARAADVLVDERHGTLVVPGERGRMHFYTADGRHVSSVRYSRDAVDRKRKLGLWRAASPDEAQALITALGIDGASRAG